MAEQEPVRPSLSTDAENSCFFSFATGVSPSTAPPTLHVAVVSHETGPIFEGFRHYPGTEVLLVHTAADAACAHKIRDAFRRAGVSARLHPASDVPYYGTLQAINDIVHDARLSYPEIVVNTSSGSPAAGCAALTAAYLHGLRAFHVEGEEARLLPILPVGQREILHETDVKLLLALQTNPRSEPRLARATGLPQERVRAHLEGDPTHKGLIALGLIERCRRFGLLPMVRLSASGRGLLASGAVTSPSPTV